MTYTAQSHVSYGDTWTAGQHNTMIDNIADGHSNETALREKTIIVELLNTLQVLGVVDGVGDLIFPIPSTLNGWNLTSAHAVLTKENSSSGTPTFQIHNLTDGVDMLSTRITVDENEYTSYTAAAQSVVDTTKDDVATGDRIRFDCDVAGTGVLGLAIIMTFQIP